MIYVRRIKFGENWYWGEGRVYPGEARCLKESRSSDLTFFFFFFFRAQGLGNATIAVKTSQWTVDVGPLNGGSLICPLLVLKEVSFIR